MKFNKVKHAFVGCGVAVGLAAGVTVPAQASPASDQFRACVNRYSKAENVAIRANKMNLFNAINQTSLALCNYNLSQRSDISDQTEINALR